MRTLSRDSREYELTDDELDSILASAHSEIVTHVQQTVDPSAALIAIMVDSDLPEALPEPVVPCPSSRQMVPRQLTAVIETRYRALEVHQRLADVVRRARNLAIDLDRELSDHSDLTIAVLSALEFARQRDRHLVQLLSHARDLAVQVVYDLICINRLNHDLFADKDAAVVREHSKSDIVYDQSFDGIRELDRYYASLRHRFIDDQIRDARELSIRLEKARRLSNFRERWRNLDRQHAHELALAIDLALDHAKDLAAGVIYQLDAVEINVVAADLSQVKIDDPTVLVGVIWADNTIWPAEVVEDVGSLSMELAEGIYQVRPDGQRPAVKHGRHETGSIPASSRSLPWLPLRPTSL